MFLIVYSYVYTYALMLLICIVLDNNRSVFYKDSVYFTGSVQDTKQVQKVPDASDKGLEELDALGQSLMQQTLTHNKANYTFNPT